MNKNLTEIAIVLDRSGSMACCRESTIAGFNEFVEGQKNTPGEANLSLAQFDSENPFELLFDRRPLRNVPKLNSETFVPRGGTPLHDAIGKMIVDLGAKLQNTPEADRPGQVIVVIMTDGFENSSYVYKAAEIAKMIEHQRSTYNWQFVFLGANQDAILTGQSLNISAAASMNMNAFDPTAVRSTYTATSAAVSRSRTMGGPVSYTNAERKLAMGEQDEQNQQAQQTSTTSKGGN